MKPHSVFCRRFRAGVIVVLLAGYLGLMGCAQEGEGSAPKQKGNKDDIQKALQSGGADKAKARAKRRG